MGKYPIYAIVALVFIGIIKLLQITAFDAEKYSKNRKASFSKDIYKPENKDDSETSASRDIFKPTKKTEETPPPVLDREEKDSVDVVEAIDEPLEEVQDNGSFENTTTQAESAKTYSGLDELRNVYLAPKIANLPPGQLREDVVVRYYRHDQDGDKVYALKELGYYIHEKEATETEGLGSNVMYYGENVAVEDIQIVAYTLLANGIPLKSIKPSSYSWKANAIEIGTNPDILEAPDLTEEEVKSFTK